MIKVYIITETQIAISKSGTNSGIEIRKGVISHSWNEL